MSHTNKLFWKSSFFVLLLISSSIQSFAKTNFARGVVVSKNEIASQAGVEALKKGGNAFDAAVATGYALGVVEPNGSGIGGGGFALVYLAKQKKLIALDFRERAPSHINDFPYEFRNGPMASGIPGSVRGFEYLRQKYGKLPRAQDMQFAINLAAEGFPINKTLHENIQKRQETLQLHEDSRKIFLPEGKVPPVGYILKQADLANTLKALSIGGAPEFYNGQTALKLARAIQKSGGIIEPADLKSYSVYLWKPICGNYRKNYKVCSFPPPSSGGVCIIEALNILESFNLQNYNYKDPERLHLLAEALRFAFADRATNLGDPRFNVLPVAQLTSPKYAKTIAERIKSSQKVIPSEQVQPFSREAAEKPETTNFTVTDKEGNIVVITVSLNGGLGSGFVAPGTGILMNNTLDDFSLPKAANQYGLVGNDLNSPQPFKTPLSSMSPTIVFNSQNQPILALGSPGGPTIISAVLNTLLAYLDQKMTVSEAVAAGRLHHQWMPDHLYFERSLIDEETQKLLAEKYGYIFPPESNSVWSKFYWSVQAVELNWPKRKLTGASDPRVEQGLLYE